MTISLTHIWDETLDFVRREAGLLAPLALATLGLGDAGTNLVADSVRAAGPAGMSGIAFAGIALAFLLSMVGQFAIIALALSPGISVGEGMRKAASRLPKFLLILFTMAWLVVLLTLPAVLMLASSGIDLGTPNPRVPLHITLYSFLALGIIAWVSVRLMTLNALIVDRNPPLLGAFREAFALTRGRAVILLGLAAVYLIVWLIVTGAVTFTLGSLFLIVAKAAGAPLLGKVLTALAGGVVAAGLGTVAAVFVAKLYRALSPSNGI